MVTAHKANGRVTMRTLIPALAACLGLALPAAAQTPPILTELQLDIVGVRLVVDPPALTVPKNIATQINTSLAVPPAAGDEVRDAVASLTAGAIVEAELRGPSFPATRITAVPGQPLPLPAFALPGDYILDNIRLVRDGETLLDATAPDGRPATFVPIHVIAEILVTSVTSRPLSLDEIKGKGIVIDETNFSAVNFEVAFNIEGAPFRIELPVALPTADMLRLASSREKVIEELKIVNQQLATLQTALPPQFDRPGLNFSIAALPFFPIIAEDGDDPPFDVPPITGLILIPGNVGFLNQFFSVMLMVANVAPDGTPLVLRDVMGTAILPKGLDRIAGTYENPGDDPLRFARIEGVGQQPTVPVALPGPDGELGTADDVFLIRPQQQGSGEFLVEGLLEGAHLIDIDIRAVLDGLPSGPVEIQGAAAGAVFVRNPTFSVTLAHPRVVRAGEPYDIFATVTNTSRSAANLVSVGLDPLAISGAVLLSDPTVSFDTLLPGQAVTARFRLSPQQTGEVTASSFTGPDGGIRLVTGVDERGAPLAPNAIVLPSTSDFLPISLITAAQRVLGQAFSIATAPAEALPEGVLFVRRQTVVDRGLELGEAGQRIEFGESVESVVRDLLVDWLGNKGLDPGFDQILRETEAGAAFLSEVASVIGGPLAGDASLAAHAALAEELLGREAPPLTVLARSAAGPGPIVRVSQDGGGATGSNVRSLVGANFLSIADEATGRGGLAVVAVTAPTRYVVDVTATSAGPIDLGVAVPGAPGTSTFLQFGSVDLLTGGTARLVIDLAAPGTPGLVVDVDGDGAADGSVAPQPLALVEQAPQVVGIRQLERSPGLRGGLDPAAFGLIVGVLFDKPVTKESAEDRSHYVFDSANRAIGSQIQPSGRLVYLYLERPVGMLVQRHLTVSGVADHRGHTVASSTQPIVATLGDGAQVFGIVRNADGQGVSEAVLRLTIAVGDRALTAATIKVERDGTFEFDFVRMTDGFNLTAQHPVTLELASVSARVRAPGQQLLLNPTFAGRSIVRGTAYAADGVTPVPNARVVLLPGAQLGRSGFTTRANAVGEFVFDNVPVGLFTLRADAPLTGAYGQVTGIVERGDTDITVNIALLEVPEEGGRLVGRVFLSDGATPAVGFPVYVGTYNRGYSTIEAIDITTTDATGSFALGRTVPAGQWDVVAVDVASGQIGVVRAVVQPLITTAVSIVMESVGSVEGVVFDGRGQLVAGALVAGGIALVETDANGFFRLEGVPAGQRSIQAGDPVSRKRGEARVNVVPGQTVSVAITLESRATIRGRVLDAAGNPVPRATVRIPSDGGFTFVFANNSGVFTFPDLPLGDYLMQAPGPSQESLIEWMQENGLDPRSAFTSGDVPPELGGDPEPIGGDVNRALQAYKEALKIFLNVNEAALTGLPIEDLGGFGWNKARLFEDDTVQVADIRFLEQGLVGGTTVDSQMRPTGALTRVRALKVGIKGHPLFGEIARRNSDAATGAFLYTGIPRFDLQTFQSAGVRADFQVEAATPFSPTIVSVSGQLNTATPDRTDLVLRFPSPDETNGRITGLVLLPDGVTPAPANTQVAISFGDLVVRTDDAGRFDARLPIPAGNYTVTAQTLVGGLRGQTVAIVQPGGSVDVVVRLLGLGSVTVDVVRPGGVPVTNAVVTLQRGTFPSERLLLPTDANGRVQFLNVSEGEFSVEAIEQGTGLGGRVSGIVVRDQNVELPLTIVASGIVTGTFVTAATGAPIPFAKIALTSGNVRAFTSTDGSGRFEVVAIPVGPFSIAATDVLTGRRGRGTGQLQFEGQVVDVTVVQVPRGTVVGFVFNADGVTRIPAARVTLTGRGTLAERLVVTTDADGGFRFEGISEGSVELEAEDPVTGAKGSATGRVQFEGEEVDVPVVLAPRASLRVTVRDEQSFLVPNATVSLAGAGVGNLGRTGAVDTAGEVLFEFLPLGTYRIVARSLANPSNGGVATVTLAEPNEEVQASVAFQGTAPVTVTVVASDGSTPVSSARVTLTASGAPAGQVSSEIAETFIAFTNASGTAMFPTVPVGAFFVRGEAAALSGVATGEIPAPDAAQAATVQLGPSGTIAGRVLLPDGVTQAPLAIVTLRFQSQSGLQSGTLQVRTGLAGTFEFGGIPVGPFTVQVYEVVSTGVRNLAGSIAADGERVELGDLVLDNTAPRIDEIAPRDATAGVATATPVSVTFNEPIQPGSVVLRTSTQTGNFAILDGSQPVAGTIAFSNGNRTVSFTPSGAFRSNALITVVVTGGMNGPKDASDFTLIDTFVSAFTTADVIPPVLVALSPASGARQVQPGASIRAEFSEPLASGVMTLADAAGQPVTGQSALTAGNTAVVFAPLDFLRANTSYTVTISGVADLAGNGLPQGTVTSQFFTVDTIAPVVTGIDVTGVLRAGSTVVARAAFADADVVRVEYAIAGGATAVSTTAPFGVSLTLPSNVTTTSITALAVDAVGNRSQPFSRVVALEVDQAPTVQLVNVGGQTVVDPGATVLFDVVAEDDRALATVLFSTVGAATTSVTRTVAPDQTTYTERFSVVVPPTAAAGQTLTVQAAAIDLAGNRSDTATLVLTVSDVLGEDDVPPAVSVLAPAAGASIGAGQTLLVSVRGTDNIGVTRIELGVSGAVVANEPRTFSPAVSPADAEFSVAVPPSATGTIELTVTAFDARNNASTPATRSVTVVSQTGIVLPPSAALLAGETASLALTLASPAGAGGVQVSFTSSNTGVVAAPAPLTIPAGETDADVELTGIAAGTATVTASVGGVPSASTEVSVSGGVVRGVVVDGMLAPVAGADVTVFHGGTAIETTTDADGAYVAIGVVGTGFSGLNFSVRAFDPATSLLGYATGQLNVPFGSATRNVVVLPAGTIVGTVFLANGTTPAGEGVRVELREGSASGPLAATVFTDDQGRYEFPLVAVGTYTIEAFGDGGHRGRSSATVSATGQEIVLPVVFLGRGVVQGVVRDGMNAPVAGAVVELRATSLFGAAPMVSVTTETDGAFRFEGVFVGSFTLSARDPVTNQAGSASGTVASDGETVTRDVFLTPFGNLQGTVFLFGGTTPVGAGATVTFDSCLSFENPALCRFTTTTSAGGSYAFTFLPLRAYTLTVSNPANRGLGRVAGALTVSGQTVTQNVTLFGQGTLVVAVLDASGQPVSGASVSATVDNAVITDSLAGVSGPTGVVRLEQLLAGSFTVTATSLSLTGTATGTLAANDELPVTVTLEPTATITGDVFLPNGTTPADAGQVRATRQQFPFLVYNVGIAGGAYSLDNLKLGTYRLDVFDGAGRRRALVRDVVLSSNGQVERRDVSFIGLGTVSGAVLNPDLSGASGLSVQLQSLNPDIGGFLSTTSGAGGAYQIANVPVGNVRVTSGTGTLLGEAFGTMPEDGATITINVNLANNAVTLPVDRYDANDSFFRIAGSGAITDSLASVFRGDFSSNQGGFLLDVLANGTATRFTGATIGTTEEAGREIVVRQQDIGVSGLEVTRKVFVPTTGYFVRYLEILRNTTDAPMTVGLRLKSNLRNFNGAPDVRATSNGNLTLQAGGTSPDRWVVLDDNSDGDPYRVSTGTPVAFVFDGEAGDVQATGLQLLRPSHAEFFVTWDGLTVPAGGTVAIMHFGAQQTSRLAAQRSAERLVQLPPEALAGLSLEEIGAVRNFDVPNDGIGIVAPLPVLTGTVSGRLFEGDGTTPVPFAQVRFTSDNPLYQRQQFVNTDGAGNFGLTGSIASRRPVILDSFTLLASHPRTGFASPATPGTFAVGETTATQNVVFSNLGVVRGTVRRASGTVVTSGTIEIRRTSPSFSTSISIGADGSYVLGGIPVGTFALTAQESHPQGSGTPSAATPVTVTAGTSVTQDVVLLPTGALTGLLLSGTGVPQTNQWVYVEGQTASLYVYRYAQTDTSGRFTFPDLPEGTWQVYSYEPATFIQSRLEVAVVAGQTTEQNLVFVGLGTLQVDVQRTNGALQSGIRVDVFDNRFSLTATTDGSGRAVFTSVPVDGPVTVRAYPSGASQLRDETQVTLGTPGAVVPLTLTLPPYGRITGTVSTPAGALAGTNRRVDLIATGISTRNNFTNASSVFAFDFVQVGPSFTLRAYHPTTTALFLDHPGNVLASDGQELVVDVRYPALATVRVTVVDGSGNPLPGLRIDSADASRTFFTNRGTTNANGQLDVPSMPQGVFTIRVRNASTGFTLAEDTGVITAADDALVVPIQITALITTGHVAGLVTAADGVTPVPSSSVLILNAADRTSLRSLFTSSTGSYTTVPNAITTGAQGFIVQARHPNNSSLNAEVADVFEVNGETRTVNVALPVVRTTVRGRVYGADGATPVPGVSVQLRTPSGLSLLSRTSDASGNFEFLNVFVSTDGIVLRGTASGGLTVDVTAPAPAPDVPVTLDVVMPGVVGTLSGRVFAGDGVTPVGQVWLELYEVLPGGGTSYLVGFNADNESRYTRTVLSPAGSLLLRVYTPWNWLGVDTPIVLPGQGAAIEQDVVLPISTITGRVTYADGTPVSSPSVYVETPNGTFNQFRTVENQYFIFEVPAGTFRIVAQDDNYGLQASTTVTVASTTSTVELDFEMPPTGTVRGTLTGLTGQPIAFDSLYLVSDGLRWEQYASTDQQGNFEFLRVPLGPVYVQAYAYDSVNNLYTYASASGDLASETTPLVLNVAFDTVGQLQLQAFNSDGLPRASEYVQVEAFGSNGPLGYFSLSRITDGDGRINVGSVPAGPVVAYFYDSSAQRYVVGSGVLSPGGTLALEMRLPLGVQFDVNLDGADGFRYDVQSDGRLGDGGTVDRALSDAYDGAYRLRFQNSSFCCPSFAVLEASDRQAIVGPAATYRGLVLTRKVFVPGAGGFARYLEIVSNPNATALPIRLRVESNLGSDSNTRVLVAPADTGGTYAMTDENRSNSTAPLLAHVFNGVGAAPVRGTAIVGPDGNDRLQADYDVLVPAGGAAIVMHFAVQRAPGDQAGATTQAEALVNLTDPAALAGLTAAERAAIVNFVLPPQ